MAGSIPPGVVTALLMVACGSDGRSVGLEEPPGPAATDDGGVTHVPPPVDAGCAEGKEGCSCDTPGAKFDCGQVERISGSYVSCSPGFATCSSDLVWGACLGDRIAHEVTGATTQ
ncbi:MAG TPA: hypothetical protein VF395_16085 [Polyangiaceae bacterium]